MSIILAMEVWDATWTDLLVRVTEKVLHLESVSEQISQELQIQKAIREEWQNWNEGWKSAWLLSQDDQLRLTHSVHRRIQAQKNSFPNT
ncbi:MAG: hypothetical protein MH321_01195 [Leptospiraceae bacterium]|nr:hypothetical protein [Leptospiraceae bacterium]